MARIGLFCPRLWSAEFRDDTGTCSLGGTGDISNGNADLDVLANNGGPTETHALLPASDAIEFGLGFATVLTLGFVPILYSLFYRVRFRDFTYRLRS